MQAMMDFSSWFLSQIPTFLMAEPMRYFLGIIITIAIIDGLIIRIFRIK